MNWQSFLISTSFAISKRAAHSVKSVAPKLGEIIELEIEKIVFGGQGLARHNQIVVFVPFSAPGDRLKVRVKKTERNFVTAEIVEILSPGPGRQDAPCKYFGRCGGCNLQHISTSVQLQQKEAILRDNLEKIFAKKLGLSQAVEESVQKIIPSPKNLRYRNRIQPNFINHQVGFYARESHDLIAIDDCLICEELLAQALPKLASEKRENGRYELQLRPDMSVDTIPMDGSYEGFGFAQVNRFQNEQLIEHVLNLVQPHSRLIDLYAGAGNFSFPLAKKFQTKMIAVELSSKLVQKFNRTVQETQASQQIQSFCSDVEAFLKRFQFLPDDVVVLDPPRAGVSEMSLQSLAQSGVRQIIYISCDPAALARDLERFYRFSSQVGLKYKLSSIQPFEMFPQTDHMETILDLRIDSQA